MRHYLAVLACLTALGAGADTGTQLPVFELQVHYDTLANGLRYLIVEDTSVAVVSCRLYYFVGSMYEGPGTSGLSHMYEHMLFKGTRVLGTTSYKKESPYLERIDEIDARIHALRAAGFSDTDSTLVALRAQAYALLEEQRRYIRKDEIWSLYQAHGGTQLNAWTSDALTAYIVTLPRNHVELFYWIESDRMHNTVLREFFSERDVVIEERLMRYENRPLGRYFENLIARFYIAHPYRIPTIGWMSDIKAYNTRILREHVQRFYTPDNALLVLNGNIDAAQASRDIKRYFSSIPRATVPRPQVVTREPPPAGQTRFTTSDDAEPRIDILFHTPGYPDSSLFVLDAVQGVLSGASGRLYRRLVLEENLCTNAGATNRFRLHNGYFHVWATLRESTQPAVVESLILEELAALAHTPPTQRELLRVKNEITFDFARGLKSLEGLSDRLAWFERLGSWKELQRYPERIMLLETGHIPAVVRRYLDASGATFGVLNKQPPPQPQGEDS